MWCSSVSVFTSVKAGAISGQHRPAWRSKIQPLAPCATKRKSPFAKGLFLFVARRDFCRTSGDQFAGLGINGVSVRRGFPAADLGLLQPVAFAVHLQDVDMVGQPIEERSCEPF
jgi:hypothetical protein